MLRIAVRGLEENIPRMVSFMESPIDQQPWERTSDCQMVPSQEDVVEINLMSFMRDMMGHVAIPALFGHAFFENFPHILEDVYEMDCGMQYLLLGLPRWIPIPTASKAGRARANIWRTTTIFHKALDAYVENRNVDTKWDDMDDVSELIKRRHAIFKGTYDMSSCFWEIHEVS
jgi:hypothetical protein